MRWAGHVARIWERGDVYRLQVREEYPICVQSQNTTKHKTKFITLLQHYNNMFRPKLSAIVRLYMKPIVCMP